MRTLIISVFLLLLSIGYAQKEGGKLSLKTDFDLYVGHTAVYTPNIKIGTDFFTKENDITLYLTYNFMKQSLYKGHYLGISFEHHFLSKEKRFRPYFGLSFMSEVTSNYKEGFLSADNDNGTSFVPNDNYILYSTFYYYYDTYHSGFYYSTPLFGTASLGFDVRLIKDLHLNFSLGYGLQLMRYKYFKWKSYEDYRELLKSRPMKSRKLHYVNAELGLRYEFSFKKES